MIRFLQLQCFSMITTTTIKPGPCVVSSCGHLRMCADYLGWKVRTAGSDYTGTVALYTQNQRFFSLRTIAKLLIFFILGALRPRCEALKKFGAGRFTIDVTSVGYLF